MHSTRNNKPFFLWITSKWPSMYSRTIPDPLPKKPFAAGSKRLTMDYYHTISSQKIMSALLIRKSSPSFVPRDSYSIDREKVLRIWIFNTHHMLSYQAVLRNTTAAWVSDWRALGRNVAPPIYAKTNLQTPRLGALYFESAIGFWKSARALLKNPNTRPEHHRLITKEALGVGSRHSVCKALQVISVCSQVGADEILSNILPAPYSNRTASLAVSAGFGF